MEGKGGPQHKYLQSLIKRMAEEKGFRAIIEKHQQAQHQAGAGAGLLKGGGGAAK